MAKLFSRRKKRMKKRLFASVGLSLLALNVFGSAAYATENTEKLQSEFIQEGIQADVNIQFKGGPLRLVEASDFSFGTVRLSKGYVNMPALGQKHYAQVSDARGTKQGWTLGASLSPIVGENGKELRGAELRLLGAEAIPDSYIKIKEEDKAIAIKNTFSFKGASTKLSAGGSFQTLMMAKKGQGQGDYSLVYRSNSFIDRNDSVRLFVPAGVAEAQNYKGHVNWVLTNAPY